MSAPLAAAPARQPCPPRRRQRSRPTAQLPPPTAPGARPLHLPPLPPPLQALVKFSPGATAAGKGRALARGQARQEEVVSSAADGEWVRVTFVGPPGASTAKAAKRIEEDPDVQIVEVGRAPGEARAGGARGRTGGAAGRRGAGGRAPAAVGC